MIGHRSPEFRELFGGIRRDLKPLFGTTRDAFVITASGTGVMQAALKNCVAAARSRHDLRRVLRALVRHRASRSGSKSIGSTPAGETPSIPKRSPIISRRRRAHYDAVTLTHNETSTGVTNDVAALARVVHEESPDTLVLVDAVSSLGGIPVRFDEWGLDVCLASVQKGIALPPGITVFAVSARALERREEASVPRHSTSTSSTTSRTRTTTAFRRRRRSRTSTRSRSSSTTSSAARRSRRASSAIAAMRDTTIERTVALREARRRSRARLGHRQRARAGQWRPTRSAPR